MMTGIRGEKMTDYRNRGRNVKQQETDRDLEGLSDHELFVELTRQQREDTRYQKRTAIATWAVALVLLIACLILIPKAVRTLHNLNDTMVSVTETSTQLQGTLSDLDEVIGNVNGLVEENTDYVNDAIKELNSIDFNSLNRSIKALEEITGPLASLFHR